VPQISVFGFRLSPLVEKVVRALEYKALVFELVTPSSMGDAKEWNPETGKMPVIDIDGERVHDSTFIVRRLEEVEPNPPLISGDPVIAAQQRLLEDWSDESLYWYVGAMRWAPENVAATTDQIFGLMPPPSPLRPLVRRLLRRRIGGMMRAQGLARLPMATLERELGGLLDTLVSILGHRPYFYADELSVADLAIFGQLESARSGPTPQAVELIKGRPALTDWMERVEQGTESSG
jgi:glutathione S-transferase